MKRRTIAVFAFALLLGALVVGTAGIAFAWGPGGMMGGYGQDGSRSSGATGPGYGPGYGHGMMGGSGYGPGMMGGWGQGNPNQPAISLDQAQKDVQNYLNQTGNSDLTIDEVMEFQNNFYAIVKEKSTGLGAFEVLIDKASGVVTSEPGPNMMWNTKYGMMSQNSPMGQRLGYPSLTGPVTVSADQAKQIAQKWLDQNKPGSATEAPDRFYGYYTVHILQGGKVTGMLSVNGYSGQVWYHTWHGAFIQMRDLGA